jgi:translation initiation factor IF-3
VRCIGENGELIGIITTSQALNMANAAQLDLVEISPNAQPPVCRIMNVGKYKYEVEKKEREARKHQTHTKVKEVKFHANTDTHDFELKVRHIRDFIADGHRCKVSLMFRGREQAHQEIGYDLMRRVAKSVEDVATGDKNPQHMGRTLLMMFAPRPGVPKAKAQSEAAAPASQPAQKPQPAAPAPQKPPQKSGPPTFGAKIPL